MHLHLPPLPMIGLRRRRPTSEPAHEQNQNQRQTQLENATNHNPCIHTSSSSSISTLIYLFLHLASIAILLLGIYLRSHFHNGSDCEMTYSQRRFQRISSDTLAPHSVYNLYQFHDERIFPFTTNRKSTIAVLYIPGHWGSFTQCRSLGAHGVQLTRQYHETPTLQDQVLYDTFCVDFKEQGSGLHGSLLMAQRDYLNTIVATLNITILVGHSLGGLVATRISHQHALHAIITMATPHKGIPYTLEQSIHTFLHQPTTQMSNVLSISGGLKDEMIPSALCDYAVGKTVYANDIMTIVKHNHDGLGMDHKAIVWCHNLLAVVQTAIVQLSTTNVTNATNVTNLFDNKQQQSSTVQQMNLYRLRHGWWHFLCIESAMLYHVELCLGMFAIQSALHRSLSNDTLLLLIPMFVSILAILCTNRDISFGATLVLSFVASTSRIMIVSMLQNTRVVLPTMILISTLAFRIALVPWRMPSIVCEFGLAVSVLVWAASMIRRDAMVVVCLPLLVLGKGVAYYHWSFQQDLQGLPEDMIQFLGIIVIPVAVWLVIHPTNHMPCIMVVMIILISCTIGEMLHVGGGFRVGYFVSILSLVDSMNHMFTNKPIPK